MSEGAKTALISMAYKNHFGLHFACQICMQRIYRFSYAQIRFKFPTSLPCLILIVFTVFFTETKAHSSGGIAMRSEGSPSAPVSSRLSPGDDVDAILYVGRYWNRIRMKDGKVGWVKKNEMRSLHVHADEITIVQTRSTLRAEGSPNSAPVSTIERGTVIIETLYQGNYWNKVVTNHGTGWIRKSDLSGHSHESVFNSTSSRIDCSLARNVGDLASEAQEILEVATHVHDSPDSTDNSWLSPVADRYCRIGSRFGMRTHPITGRRQMHTGMDLPRPQGGASQSGHPIVSPFNGTVESAGPNGNCGNYLKIRSEDGIHAMGFCHLQGVSSGIRPGVRVQRGQSVARIGSTGLSTGPHAHIIVYRNGEKVNPLNYYTESQLCR